MKWSSPSGLRPRFRAARRAKALNHLLQIVTALTLIPRCEASLTKAALGALLLGITRRMSCSRQK